MSVMEILAEVSEDLGFTKKDVKAVVDAFFDKLVAEVVTLQGKEKVSIPGFGAFVVVDKPARKARNPKTGESVDVSASRKPKFRPASEFKKVVNV